MDVKLVSPIESYNNAEASKEEVLKNNRGKSGIYRWVNNLNGKTYVGSALDLAKRLVSYYNIKELNRNSRPIKDAYSLLGYKHSKENIEKFKSKIISPEHKKIISELHKGKLVSEETRNKLAAATAEYRKKNSLTSEALANIKAKTTEREGVAVSVLNTQTKEIKQFTNQTEAGAFLGVSRQAVYNAIKRGSTVNGFYLITKV